MKKLLVKYKNLSLPAKVSVWFFFCALLQKGLAFLTTPVFTRVLSTEDFGVVSVFNSWEQIAVIFVTLGLSNSVFNVGLVHNPNDRNNFQSSMLGLSFCCATCCSVILWILYPIIQPIVGLDFRYFILMVLFCFFGTVLAFWSLRERFEYHYKSMAIISILNVVLGTALSLIFVYFGEDKAWGKVLGAGIATILAGFFCCISFLKKSTKVYDFKYWLFATKFNIPMIPHFLSGVLLNQLDRIMIKNMCGESHAGVYSVAYNSAMVVHIINQAISSSYNPWLMQNLKQKNFTNISSIVNSILLGYLGVLILVILFAPEIMQIMAPAAYQEGVYVIPPVAGSMFFILLFNIFAPIEQFSLKTKFMATASTVSAIANIVLNLIFIDLFGYLAAGYTTLVCYIIYALSHFIFMKKICRQDLNGINLFNDKLIWSLSAIVVIISILSTVIYHYRSLRYGLVVIIIMSICAKKEMLKGAFAQMKKK